MEETDLPTFRRVVVQKRSYAQASIITIAVEDAGRGKIDTGQRQGRNQCCLPPFPPAAVAVQVDALVKRRCWRIVSLHDCT